MSPLKEVESAVGVSDIIQENAKQDEWRLLEEDGYEIENLVGVHILVFGKKVDDKSVIEVAGVIQNRNIEDIREGRGDFVFGPRVFLKGVVEEEDKKEEGKEKELYPGYQPASGNEVFCANLEAIVRRTMIKKKEIAEKIGVHPSHITRITAGRSAPSIEVAFKIANAIDLDLAELVTSREIDSWLADHLSTFERVGIEEMTRVLLPDAKRQLLEIFKVVEEKKEAVPSEEEFHLLEVLSTRQKWNLRSIIEQVEEGVVIR